MSNAAEHLINMRDNLGEEVAAHWKDRQLLYQLNASQARLSRRIATNNGGWLEVSTDVTPVAGVITLPIDCAKVVYLEEKVSGRPISIDLNVMERRVSRVSGTTLSSGLLQEGYIQLGTIVINSDSFSIACTLWYQIRVPDLHVGTAGAGGVTSLTLSADDGIDATAGNGHGAKEVADYYNNSKVQVITGTGAGGPIVISAYTAARVATLASGTYSTSSDYGTISRLPEEAWDVMVLDATLMCMAKPSSTIDPQVFSFYRDRLKAANEEFDEWIATPFRGSQRTRITEIDE